MNITFLFGKLEFFGAWDFITLIAPCNLPLLKGEELIDPLS
jgi:hypothetical protein